MDQHVSGQMVCLLGGTCFLRGKHDALPGPLTVQPVWGVLQISGGHTPRWPQGSEDTPGGRKLSERLGPAMSVKYYYCSRTTGKRLILWERKPGNFHSAWSKWRVWARGRDKPLGPRGLGSSMRPTRTPARVLGPPEAQHFPASYPPALSGLGGALSPALG